MVDHKILLLKLRNFGLCDNLLNLISSFLSSRTQFVEYGGFRSKNFNVPSGVTQGSNLGPLLFVIFFNDVISQFNCNVFVYADDLKLANSINCINDCLALQNDLDKFVSWCHANKLKLNIDKCSSMTYTRKTKQIIKYSYTLDNVVIPTVSEIKDLGVYMDPALSFINHVQYICQQALKMVGFIIRNTKGFKSVECLLKLYNAYVLSRFDYCSIIWCPFYYVHVAAIEKVQRKFCKYLYFIKYGTYPDRHYSNELLLKEFSLFPLYQRRSLACCMLMFKLIHGHINSPEILENIMFRVPRPGSRCNEIFICHYSRTNQHMFSPINNLCKTVNLFAEYVDIFNNNFNLYMCSCRSLIVSESI